MIAAVVLAAGGSTRLGRPKQLLQPGGVSLVRHATDCCRDAGCVPVIVVVGAEAARVRSALDGSGARAVRNDAWRTGLASSIRAGVEALPAAVEAKILAVCDQPRLTPAVIRRLVEAHDASPGRIVASAYAGTLGTPALFCRDRFAELCALRGDAGAKPVLERHAIAVRSVPWPDGALDVDRPGDLGEARRG